MTPSVVGLRLIRWMCATVRLHAMQQWFTSSPMLRLVWASIFTAAGFDVPCWQDLMNNRAGVSSWFTSRGVELAQQLADCNSVINIDRTFDDRVAGLTANMLLLSVNQAQNLNTALQNRITQVGNLLQQVAQQQAANTALQI